VPAVKGVPHPLDAAGVPQRPFGGFLTARLVPSQTRRRNIMPLLRPPRHDPSRQEWFRAQTPTFGDEALRLPRLVPGGNLTLEI
jgi:hypothetical protein